MPWEKTGTISVAQHSNAVIGAGTSFITNGRVGDAFRGPDGAWYEVVNIASDSALSIAPAYQGATVSGAGYALAPMQGYVKESADQLRTVVNTVVNKISDLGTTGNYDILPVSKGGTGASNQADARSALNLSTTDGLPEGTNLYFNGARVLGAVLAGFSAASNAVVTAADTVLGAFGKLQAQVSARALKGANADITSLAGLTTALTIAQGGTGANTAAGARINMGITSNQVVNVGCMELIADTPYIDMHYGQSTADYTLRMIQPSSSLLQVSVPSGIGVMLGVGCYPVIDNSLNCGTSTNRWSTVFAASGVISTSDARRKTAVEPLTEAELSAAAQLASEIGFFRWLDDYQRKGEGARRHCGMTVQRAIEIMQAHGLQPFDYGFICYDAWAATAAVVVDVKTQDGQLEPFEAAPAKAAGDIYSFRFDQLALFISRGQEARLAKLERALGGVA